VRVRWTTAERESHERNRHRHGPLHIVGIRDPGAMLAPGLLRIVIFRAHGELDRHPRRKSTNTDHFNTLLRSHLCVVGVHCNARSSLVQLVVSAQLSVWTYVMR
jgi:hypothetical protein